MVLPKEPTKEAARFMVDHLDPIAVTVSNAMNVFSECKGQLSSSRNLITLLTDWSAIHVLDFDSPNFRRYCHVWNWRLVACGGTCSGIVVAIMEWMSWGALVSDIIFLVCQQQGAEQGCDVMKPRLYRSVLAVVSLFGALFCLSAGVAIAALIKKRRRTTHLHQDSSTTSR